MIGGRRPVLEALLAGRKFREIFVAQGARPSGIEEIEREAESRGIPVRRVPRPAIDEIAPVAVHQGVLAYVEPIAYAALEDVLQRAAQDPPGLLLVLDGIEDPQNLGALIRSADAAGAHGVIVGKHRAARLTETAVKASAGAAFHLPVVQVTNITRTLRQLKEHGYWVVGASLRAKATLWDVDLRGPVAIVIGSEGRGISRLVEETCDLLALLPMKGAVSSLNASVAGALFLYEALRQRSTNSQKTIPS